MYDREHDLISSAFILFIFAVVIALLLATAVYSYHYLNSEQTIQITVQDKERERKGRGNYSSSKYIVHANDESFEVTDSILFWRWNSTDVYRDLRRGKTYRVRVVGWRKPFLSWYRNILEIETELPGTGSMLFDIESDQEAA